ncbi:MAG: hypothetical protein DI629_18975 [Mesorhizobium amorphae]|nr:MAG: hypothetical protein DI629_18975 [Mesorhizobium amorphae]
MIRDVVRFPTRGAPRVFLVMTERDGVSVRDVDNDETVAAGMFSGRLAVSMILRKELLIGAGWEHFRNQVRAADGFASTAPDLRAEAGDPLPGDPERQRAEGAFFGGERDIRTPDMIAAGLPTLTRSEAESLVLDGRRVLDPKTGRSHPGWNVTRDPSWPIDGAEGPEDVDPSLDERFLRGARRLRDEAVDESLRRLFGEDAEIVREGREDLLVIRDSHGFDLGTASLTELAVRVSEADDDRLAAVAADLREVAHAASAAVRRKAFLEVMNEKRAAFEAACDDPEDVVLSGR